MTKRLRKQKMDHEYFTIIEDSQEVPYVEKEGDELFIELVKGYPHLYDKKNSNYKDIIMKDNSWAEVASIMNWTVDKCQNRWLRLREKFGREMKKYENTSSGMESQLIHKWPLHEHMKFLEKCINSRKRVSNLQPRCCGRTVVDDNTSNIDEKSDQERQQSSFVDSPITDSRPGSSCASDTPKSCYTPCGKKKKQDAVDASFIELSSAIKNHLSSIPYNESAINDDADDLFCKFITAELKKRNEPCKSRLKQEITALIFSSE